MCCLFLFLFFIHFFLLGPRTDAIVGQQNVVILTLTKPVVALAANFKWFNYVGITENITMRSMLQTVRPLENVGFTIGDPRRP